MAYGKGIQNVPASLTILNCQCHICGIGLTNEDGVFILTVTKFGVQIAGSCMNAYLCNERTKSHEQRKVV